MGEPHALSNDRTRAVRSDCDIVPKLSFWSAGLHDKGLHAEALTMTDARALIEVQRAHIRDLERKLARRTRLQDSAR